MRKLILVILLSCPILWPLRFTAHTTWKAAKATANATKVVVWGSKK